MTDRYVHLTPRLVCALSMLRGSRTVADIGCDHGRLTAALLQQNVCDRVIAADISKPSLEKAERLLSYIGLADRVSFRLGDGLEVLSAGEVDAIAMLGMGGTLMVEILNRCPQILSESVCLVLQPMRAQSDIRRFLYLHNYVITDDRIIYEHGRYYQVFRAIASNERDPWPQGFPIDFFDVGYRSFADRDALLAPLCRLQFSLHEKQMQTARGTEGERKLAVKTDALRKIIKVLSERDT